MSNLQNWEDFWQEYRKVEATSELDLHFQVGRTIQKKPVEKEVFDADIRRMIDRISLNGNDVLVELCCGNGICTYEFKDVVKQIIATDFSVHLMDTAKKFKSAANIQYQLAGCLDFLRDYDAHFQVAPSKYLMINALAYFTPDELELILSYIIKISGDNFKFLIIGVPDDERKWNFYNTEDRKKKYYDDIANGDSTNGGLGRWWERSEIKSVCERLGLNCSIEEQEHAQSNYRIDVIISK